ncbi:hypothetical protein EYF80_006553 [Liparis tanakae]|uniref:Uncharacterized protein n=1 Tax=Liparis tanakae TaxID=230148 RepID=A0A4Z2IZ19_9TELE|nr:hypothetical protein EYF80_006553 [Liparis tanakae]
MEPGLSKLGTWNAVGATWGTGATAGAAAAGVGTGATVGGVVGVVLSGVASNVGAALAGAGVVASVGAVTEGAKPAVGAVVARGGTGDGAGTATAAIRAAGSDTATGLALSTTGRGAEAARRLPKDVGEAEAKELAGGTEKACLRLGSGGLNKLPAAAPLDRSGDGESSADFWRPEAKLNAAAPLLPLSAVSPKLNEPAAGLASESLASSPWPTRSPEKLPRVSPPIVLRGCGSILGAGVAEAAFSPDALEGWVGDPVPGAGLVDIGVWAKGSSPAWVFLPLHIQHVVDVFHSKRNILLTLGLGVLCPSKALQ